ncbi:hypothetical protein [Streptomyces erythrochromogenes]|uniref:hypothetical protein n=1 Tax=Streptomyces erythrochromogenes TaxID=285574 RepID=UPI0036AECD80
MVTTPAPDSHDDLAHAVRDGALSDLGYTLVPQRLLHQRCDGVTRLTDEDAFIAHPAPQDRATWWTRFFEHL